MTINFNGEEAKETLYKGYFATRSGKIISTKVKGGQGRIDYNNPREHNYKIDKDGYLEVLFSDNGKHIYRRVHRIVWETFNGIIENGLTIDHIDKNKQNNSLNNLRLLTREENTSIANKNKPSSKAYKYSINNEILTRKEIENKYGLSNHFWYKKENKINTLDYKYKDIIFKRV